jgi:hypothetical protein
MFNNGFGSRNKTSTIKKSTKYRGQRERECGYREMWDPVKGRNEKSTKYRDLWACRLVEIKGRPSHNPHL